MSRTLALKLDKVNRYISEVMTDIELIFKIKNTNIHEIRQSAETPYFKEKLLKYLKGEALILREFYEKHWYPIIPNHCFNLIIETA